MSIVHALADAPLTCILQRIPLHVLHNRKKPDQPSGDCPDYLRETPTPSGPVAA